MHLVQVEKKKTKPRGEISYHDRISTTAMNLWNVNHSENLLLAL